MAKKKPPKKTTTKKRKKPNQSVDPPPERQQMYSDESIAAALIASGGLIYTAAKMLKCSMPTIYNRVKVSPELKVILREERGLTVDESMIKLRKAASDGAAWAIRFTLETLGKNRGFVARTESRIGGDKNAPPIKSESVIAIDDLPLELRIALLDHLDKKEHERETAAEGGGTSQSEPEP